MRLNEKTKKNQHESTGLISLIKTSLALTAFSLVSVFLNEFVLDIAWYWRVLCKFHSEFCFTLRHRAKVGSITKHFCKRYFRNDCGIAKFFTCSNNVSTTLRKVTYNTTLEFRRCLYFHFHNWFKNLCTSFFESLAESHTSANLERHIRRVHIMVLTVFYFHFNTNHWEPN